MGENEYQLPRKPKIPTNMAAWWPMHESIALAGVDIAFPTNDRSYVNSLTDNNKIENKYIRCPRDANFLLSSMAQNT